MNYKQKTKFQTIDLLEKAILDCKHYNAVWLGVNLRELRDLRRDLYSDLTESAKNDEQIKRALIEEYDRYCRFTNSLFFTKKLSNAGFAEILHTFLSDYDFIDTLDADKTAYRLTLRTMDYIRVGLKNSDGKMSNYRLRGVNKLLKQFIVNNSPHQEEPNKEKTL